MRQCVGIDADAVGEYWIVRQQFPVSRGRAGVIAQTEFGYRHDFHGTRLIGLPIQRLGCQLNSLLVLPDSFDFPLSPLFIREEWIWPDLRELKRPPSPLGKKHVSHR